MINYNRFCKLIYTIQNFHNNNNIFEDEIRKNNEPNESFKVLVETSYILTNFVENIKRVCKEYVSQNSDYTGFPLTRRIRIILNCPDSGIDMIEMWLTEQNLWTICFLSSVEKGSRITISKHKCSKIEKLFRSINTNYSELLEN